MPLHFFPNPPEEEKKWRDLAKETSQKLIAPTIDEDDLNCRYPKEIFQAFGKLGLVAGEKKFRSYYASIDEIAQFSISFAIVIGVTNITIGGLKKYGTPEQKAKYLPQLLSGEWLGAFSLSEPGSGSDAANLKLQAVKTKGGYMLNGTKCWCSNAGNADLYLVIARTGPDKTKGITAFLIHKDLKGFKIGKQEKKMGLKSSSLAELIFENCFVEDANRLGDEGQGFEVALSQLEGGRIGIASCGLGAATRALEIITNCRIKTTDKMAEFYARLQATKSLMAATTDLRDAGKLEPVLASSLKLLATDLAMEISSYALEYIPLEDTKQRIELERIFRDSKALQIVEGTNQIQKIIIARDMGIQV